MKQFYTTHNVGKAKYVVGFHDGTKKHSDGSDFFDIKIFTNKISFRAFLNSLINSGYAEITGGL